MIETGERPLGDKTFKFKFLVGGQKYITFLVTHRGHKPAMCMTSGLKHPLGYRVRKYKSRAHCEIVTLPLIRQKP